MTTQGNSKLHNPHLNGDSFFWKNGPTGILLSHGYTATTAEVRPLAERLHRQGYTVAGPLLPGHGTQPDDLNHTRWQDWVQTGQETLMRLFETCETVWVGGESMGGVLALYLAAHHPQIKGILLYAPALVVNMTWLDQIKLYLGSAFMSQIGRSKLDNPDKWQGYPSLPLKGIIQLLQFQKATLPLLPRIHQPVLIFQGRLDETVAPETGQVILQSITSPVKELHWMEQSHHTIILDIEFEQVLARTLSFLAQNR
ncbi:MAG: hypothetical protein DDG60_00710 [Anaerolineae bacterium]|nr:MAG: hypothetical protein DDG60_00710 [Anaerolineae bacterium]